MVNLPMTKIAMVNFNRCLQESGELRAIDEELGSLHELGLGFTDDVLRSQVVHRTEINLLAIMC